MKQYLTVDNMLHFIVKYKLSSILSFELCYMFRSVNCPPIHFRESQERINANTANRFLYQSWLMFDANLTSEQSS